MAESQALANRRKELEDMVHKDLHCWSRARVLLFMKHVRLAEPHMSTLVAELEREYEKELKRETLKEFLT